jgi:endonuclease/exonuclease/phosphatase family metal-dependent hydrolase
MPKRPYMWIPLAALALLVSAGRPASAAVLELATPPAAATPQSPSGSLGLTPPPFTWTAVPGSTWYYLWINDARGIVLQRWFEAGAAGCAAGTGTCTANPGITLVGAGTWWVQTWNATGYGPWSTGLTFSGAVPPAASLPQNPSGTIADAAPAFSWSAVADSTYYYLWVNDSRGNVLRRWFDAASAGCAAGSGTCTVNPGLVLSGSGTWWVQTWNPAGEGPWSAGRTFSVQPASTTGRRLRILDWNIHHGVGTDGVYDINRLASWMANMNPDVIVLNEVEKFTYFGNEDQPARFKGMMAARTGRTWYSHFAQEYGQWSSNGKGHLILSTYPIESWNYATITPSSGLGNGGVISQATITVNYRTINLFLTHLDPYDREMRLTQARDAINWAAGYGENRIMTGDMNAWNDQTAILEFYKTYSDSWLLAESKGTAYASSAITPYGATRNGRIDYIMYSKGASNLVAIESQVYDTRDASGYMPSDHRPVVTTFEVR